MNLIVNKKQGTVFTPAHGWTGWIVLIVILLAALGCTKKNQEPAPKPVNLMLVTLDTLRLDHTGAYGYELPTTLNLDRFSEKAFRFTQAVTPVSTTDPAHMSIMTGRRPHRIKLFRNGKPLAESETTLAEIFKKNGYSTAAFTSVRHLGAKGYDQGFDVYIYPQDVHTVKGDLTVAKALDWLKSGPPEPFFIWVHLFDPHQPHDAPEELVKQFLPEGWPWSQEAEYDGEIAFADQCFGKLIDYLDRENLTDRTTVVVAADHGETIDEAYPDLGAAKHFWDHGWTVSEPDIRVFMLLKQPGLTDRSKVLDDPLELPDIFPTVLDFMEVPIPQGLILDGVSFAPYLKGETRKPPRRETYSYAFRQTPWICARGARWKLVKNIIDGSMRFTDHLKDPLALNNLAYDPPGEQQAHLMKALDDWNSQSPLAGGDDPNAWIEAMDISNSDPNVIESLKSLGYLSPDEPDGHPIH